MRPGRRLFPQGWWESETAHLPFDPAFASLVKAGILQAHLHKYSSLHQAAKSKAGNNQDPPRRDLLVNHVATCQLQRG